MKAKLQQLREENAALARSAAAVSSDAGSDADDGPHIGKRPERPDEVAIGDTAVATSSGERNLPENPPEGTASPARPHHKLIPTR